MVSLTNGQPTPIAQYPDRDEARKLEDARYYQDDRYPCKEHGLTPVRYIATDDCVQCINTRAR